MGLRIVGGTYRGRKLKYSGDFRVRPMKDRVREALFNVLGPAVKGKYAIDLFAGTGALALEALSRGAKGATLIERHLPTARIIRENIDTLGAGGLCQVEVSDAFHWFRSAGDLGSDPWLVFCAPPYAFYAERRDEMMALIGSLLQRAPNESLIVVEADVSFDFATLPRAEQWDVRPYPPAVIGIYQQDASV